MKSLPLTERTVRDAALLVAWPTPFVNTAWNHLPWSAAVAANVNVVEVAPATSVHGPLLVAPTCHRTASVGEPVAAAEKAAGLPAFRVRLDGCAVTDGATPIEIVAVFEFAWPPVFDTRTQ